MLLDPNTLQYDFTRLEEIEKSSLRLVVQAILDFRDTATEIFKMEKDLVADIGEDLTNELNGNNALEDITIAALPNGFLQNNYNPSARDTIFIAGRNAPSRGEEFRVRLSFGKLKEKANWRVQTVKLSPSEFIWDD